MYRGTVSFLARIKGNGLTFPSLVFNPSEPGVEKVEIEGPNGDEIRTTVHLASVASHDDGKALAEKVNTAASNRIAFNHLIAIENARITSHEFLALDPQPGVLTPAAAFYFLNSWAVRRPPIGVAAAELKTELELTSPPGEHNYGLFRSARQSSSAVEEFMHLYNILLMIFNDSQADVDASIVREDPAVPQTQHPLKAFGVMETVYTRLRNELAHKRPGVNLNNTKGEMANRLGELIALTKRAIELHP